MASKSQTTIVIAHRLSTISGADRICVIAEGKVLEIGTHEELMSKPNGHYRRLQAFQDLQGGARENLLVPTRAVKRKMKHPSQPLHDGEEVSNETNSNEDVDENMSKSNAKRARLLAKEDWKLFVIGGVGAILAG